jgi:hypothetical protein
MPPEPDPMNAASAMLRMEARTFLRGLKNPGERLKLILDDASMMAQPSKHQTA